ncbi:MAG: hypothetical protein ACRD3T_04805 [Terriglobia bacterium]
MRIAIAAIVGAGLSVALTGVPFAGAQDQVMNTKCPAGTHWLATSYGGYCVPGHNYALVDLRTHSPLSGSVRIASLSNSLSNISEYARLVLGGMGCAASGLAQGSQSGGAGRNGAHGHLSSCKLHKLYIDPAADGTPEGKALVEALTKALVTDGRVDLVASRNDAEALFVELTKYKIELKAAEAAEEAKREEAQQAQWAAQAKQEAEREDAAARRFAAAGKVGRPRPDIAYVVETDCDNAKVDLTFDVGTDQVEQKTEDAPWAELITYAPGSSYYLSAQKHDGSDYCSVSAEIYSVSFTRKQVDLWSKSPGSLVLPIKRFGKKLREADSDSAYGIAGVSYSPGF